MTNHTFQVRKPVFLLLASFTVSVAEHKDGKLGFVDGGDLKHCKNDRSVRCRNWYYMLSMNQPEVHLNKHAVSQNNASRCAQSKLG